jgi:hypothetical protein
VDVRGNNRRIEKLHNEEIYNFYSSPNSLLFGLSNQKGLDRRGM